MATINQVKQLAVADTPILFFQCEMPSGDIYYWSSHSVLFSGQQYVARVLKHNLFTLQLSADDAMDSMSQLSIVLGNADALMSELNAAIGFRGAQLTVYFAFVDLPSGIVTTEATMLFRGVAGDPQEITEETLTLNFTNKLSLQRVAIPDVRIQRTCPWNFPATLAQRQEAADGGEYGRFSKFYRCGYSADVPGGAGNLNAGQAFTSCDKSRTQCLERGMFNKDSSGNVNNRYGGFEFIPTSYLVRGATDKQSHAAAIIDNTGKANDAVPIVYGTGWLKAPVVFARNDGNLTHMEVLLGLGQIAGVLKVVVNDVEIPLFSNTTNSSATGWYSPVSYGTRQGAFNLDFVDANKNPLGDPQGSMAVLSVVVPNAISTGTSTPTVQVLMTGMMVDTYDASGSKLAPSFTNNPAWIVMDVLQRAGWSPSDLDINSFYQASLQCSETISTTDINNNPITLSRYGCNLILNKRQSAATVVRGIRVAASLMLRYGTDGLLELLPEGTLASQQAALPDGSNSVETLYNGWPAYEFSDSSADYSGIAKTSKGASTLTVSALTIAETYNRISVEFQDEQNEYQQDSLSVANTNDSDLIGFEVASQSNALGLPNFNQATRVLLRQLDKSTSGNQYIQFQTSFRALKVRPGDIIAVTYLREGFERTPFRVLKLSPSLNYEMVTIQAQVHNDDWYSDSLAVLQLPGRQPIGNVGVPLPLIGTVPHDDSSGNVEYFDFALTDRVSTLQDGSAIVGISIGFTVPATPSVTSTYVPLVGLSPSIDPTMGTLLGGSTWYYAVTAVDANGNEGSLSFTIPAAIPATSNTNTVTLKQLSFPSTAVTFNVYRGSSPQALYQISSGKAITTHFSDDGLTALPIGPPDPSFDHANFYYRNEYAGPFPVDISSANTIGFSSMGAVVNAYANLVVRISEGPGMGQERTILSNTETMLTIQMPWSIQPKSSASKFVISEAAWKLAAISSHSPALFDISYASGTVIEITGRAANILNQESNPALAPITSLPLGGVTNDAGLPSTPYCTLTAPGGGELTISQVGFRDLTNTATVTSGTLQIFSWNELNTPSQYSLAQAIDSSSTVLNLNVPASPSTPFVGQLIQIDQEVMSISTGTTANTYNVIRGAANSAAAVHDAGSLVLQLDSNFIIMPFAPGFFENRASLNYLNTVSIPDVRVAAAELFVTNSFGNSQTSSVCYACNTAPMRTLSGGQFSLQVNGYLATQQNAAPPLVVEAKHAVRDIRMSLTQPPTGYVITVDLLQNGSEFCQLVYDPSQATPTAVIDGTNLPPVLEYAVLTLNITVTLIPNYDLALNPGNDLTVTVRF
jgi:hypothetical protein